VIFEIKLFAYFNEITRKLQGETTFDKLKMSRKDIFVNNHVRFGSTAIMERPAHI
jgi:hypothetical protein